MTGFRRTTPAILGVALVVLTLGCASRGRLELRAEDPSGKSLAAAVDSEAARRLLVDLLARRSPDPRLAALAPSLLASDPAALGPLPDQARLRELAHEVSLDFAALAFARAISADERSQAAQEAFDLALREGPTRSAEFLRGPGAFPYVVLFAPAWLYRSHPGSGADFARQRQLLDRLSIPNRLIPTAESGSVEDNAAVIATAIREAAREGTRVVVVSTSKSGAEVALALSRLREPAAADAVAAWVNAAGALRGTPLADGALRRPTWWFTRVVLWLMGANPAGLTSMATGPSRERLDGAQLPDSIAVVNVVAVPTSGRIGPKVYGGYRVLLEHGPNDGVVLLADTVWPGGINLLSLGSDHLFEALQEDASGLALLRAVDFAVRLHAGH